MLSIRRIVAFVFLFLLCSCRMKTNDIIPEASKKQHKLEKTQWKSTASSQLDSDVLLDFYTDKDVREYQTLPNGQEIETRVGTYRFSKSGHLKIKFGKLKMDQLDGYLKGKELIINESLFKTRTYYKVKDY